MFIIDCSLPYNLISSLLANSQTDEGLDKIKLHYREIEEKVISMVVKL